MTLRIILLVLVGYLALLALMYLMQRKLLYLPSEFQASPNSLRELELQAWPGTDDFRAYIGNTDPEILKGTVIVFHGNAGAAYHRDYYVTALSSLGYRVILAEYPGYGGRAGSPSEEDLVKDALMTIQEVDRQFGKPLFLWGESLGSGVICSAVKRSDITIDGLVLFLPWDSLADLAQTHYWYFPARWLIRDKYNSVQNLKAYTGNVAVVLAEKDEVIPIRHGIRLFDSLATRKKKWIFDNASHNDFPLSPRLPWWKEVMDFVDT